MLVPPWLRNERRYYGRIWESEFVIHPYPIVRDGGYRLTIHGRVQPEERGARILVTLVARNWLWILVLAPVGVTLLAQTDVEPLWVVPTFLLYRSIGCLLCWMQRRRFRRALSTALSGSFAERMAP